MAIVTVFIALSLIISVSASYFPPGKAWIIAFFGLAYIPIVILNFSVLIFWVIIRIKYSFIPFIAILISSPVFFHVFGIHFSKTEEKNIESNSFKLMTFNVRNFDLYNWEHNNETKSNIFKMLVDAQPDILCFQEFYSSDKDLGWTNEKDISKLLKLPEHYFKITNTVEKYEHWGLCTFSRFPIIGKGGVSINGKETKACVYTDLETPSGIVRVYNVHLQSFHLSYKDYETIDMKNDSALNLEAGKSIFSKMKKTYVTRGAQVQAIAKHIRSSPYPVFVCGDFNDNPSSFSYNTIKGNLNDAFLENSWGIGYTYDYWLPIFRIDYLLVDQRWNTSGFKVIGEDLSDHYPVMCTISPVTE